MRERLTTISEALDQARAREREIEVEYEGWRLLKQALEPSLLHAPAETCYQFERSGYFVADRVGSNAGAPVFNRAVALKDSWGGAP